MSSGELSQIFFEIFIPSDRSIRMPVWLLLIQVLLVMVAEPSAILSIYVGGEVTIIFTAFLFLLSTYINIYLVIPIILLGISVILLLIAIKIFNKKEL